MTKARSDSKQLTVQTHVVDGKTTVQIFINEETEKVNPIDGGDSYTQYVYDFNEWTDDSENVDVDAIKANPASYIDYQPAPKMTAEQQRIADLEDMITSIIGGEQ